MPVVVLQCGKASEQLKVHVSLGLNTFRKPDPSDWIQKNLKCNNKY